MDNYKQLFADVWRFHQKHKEPAAEGFSFKDACRESEELYQKYKTPFSSELIQACLNEIDRRSKGAGGS